MSFHSFSKTTTFGIRYDLELAGHITLISFMTVAEIERWVLQYRWGSQRIHLLRTFLQRFTVVPSSPDLCRKWAEVMVAAQAAGRRIESADAWIAATALLHAVPLVTHNRTDYPGVAGLTLISHTKQPCLEAIPVSSGSRRPGRAGSRPFPHLRMSVAGRGRREGAGH